MGVDGMATMAGGVRLLSLASHDPSLSHPTPHHRRRPLRQILASSTGAQHDPMLPSLRAFILSVQIRRAWPYPRPRLGSRATPTAAWLRSPILEEQEKEGRI